MTTRSTKTEYKYDDTGKVISITITERKYADGGPVGPADLPQWHPWGGGGYPPEPPLKGTGMAMNIDWDQVEAIINGETPTRVTGE